MLLNTFDFIEKLVRLICYEKHCYIFILEEKMGVNTIFDNSV
jgi:hypothetical protein